MAKEKESLSEEVKKRDSDFDEEMAEYDKEIDKLNENLLNQKD